jgi:hypothetical protein
MVKESPVGEFSQKHQVPYSQHKTFYGLLQILPDRGYAIQRCDAIAGDIVLQKTTKDADGPLSIRLTDGGHQTTIHTDIDSHDMNPIIESLLAHLDGKR